VKQQHTSTATSILTTKSTYSSLSAQRLSERTLLDAYMFYSPAWSVFTYHSSFIIRGSDWPIFIWVTLLTTSTPNTYPHTVTNSRSLLTGLVGHQEWHNDLPSGATWLWLITYILKKESALFRKVASFWPRRTLSYQNRLHYNHLQFSETKVMHFLFSLLRIKGLYMFRALLAHLQEALHKRQLVYCVRVMSWCNQLI
jgi:hypothetical protein